MSYLKLLKLLYLADRTALQRFGRPITFDRYVSMDKGPVPSRTCDLIRGEPSPHENSFWREHIVEAPDDRYSVVLRDDAPGHQLSPAEEQIIDEIFAEFGHWSRWDLVKYTHTLPEYRDPEGSSIPIEIEEILRAAGYDDDDVRSVISALVAESLMHQLTE